jgi:rhamnogalacturonyl hydrolase YesR
MAGDHGRRWSRLQFQATRTARTVPHVVAAAAPLPAAITKTKKSTIQPKSKQDSAAAPQGVLGRKQPGQQGAQRKTAVASARVGSKQSKLSKPAPKKQQSGLSSFFKAASKKLATIPSNVRFLRYLRA